MSMRRFRQAVAAAALLCAAAQGPLQAQSAPPHVTRAVQVFTQLEESLLQAIRARDRARIDALLGDEFEMIVAQDPAAPVTREDWIAAVGRPDAGAFAVERMSVREAGDIAIVSFVLRPSPARTGALPVFVVDTWERADATRWQLTWRHAAPVAGSRRAIPGDAAQPTVRKQI